MSARLQQARAVQMLLGVTVLFSLFQVGAGHFAPGWDPLEIVQVVPEWFDRGEFWRPLTANLVHELGIVHLLVNMFGLILAGPAVEAALGSRAFLAVYGISGYVAWSASAWRGHSGSGASAALTGIFAALLVLSLQPGQRPTLRRAIVLSAVWLLSGPVLNGWNVPWVGTIEIADDAHIAGFATGVLLAYLLEMFRNRTARTVDQFASPLGSRGA